MAKIHPIVLGTIYVIVTASASVCATQPVVGAGLHDKGKTTGNDNNSAVAEYITSGVKSVIPEVWTFSDCVEWALANSTEVRRNLLEVLEGDVNVAEAKDAWLPTVGFSTSHSVINRPLHDDHSRANAYNGSYGINAAWTVWDGNVRKYKAKAAELLRDRTMLAGDEIERTLRLGILDAYLNIMYAREAVDIARSTLEVSTAQTDRARRLMESGRSSRVDYAQIESQRAQDAYNLVQAEGNLESAKLDLKKILQLGPETDMGVADVTFSDEQVMAPLPAVGGVFESAVNWLPQFLSNAISKDIYAIEIKRAEAGRYPSISLSGAVATGTATGGEAWGAQMGHNLNENIGVNISVPIFDANATRRAVAKARLASLDYDLTQEDLLNELNQTLERLYIDSENARARYKSGLARLESAKLTSDLTQRQFELGAVNTLELLTAHNDLLNARFELLQSKYMAVLAAKTVDFYNTGEVSLK